MSPNASPLPMPSTHAYARYRFADCTGYLVSPDGSGHGLVSVRHSALVAPWADGDTHMHASSDEFYLLLRGRLRLSVAGEAHDLQPSEMLCVRAGVAHAITGGEGRIEHFVFRAPARSDRVSLGPAPTPLAPTDGVQRALEAPWGYRSALADPRNRNCWLIGLGAALHHSGDFLFAYLDFPTHEAATAGMGTRLRLHRHERSWEYYACLAGHKMLQIGDEQVPVGPGEMLEVRPGAVHNVIARQAPYVGFTFRVPLLDDKVEA